MKCLHIYTTDSRLPLYRKVPAVFAIRLFSRNLSTPIWRPVYHDWNDTNTLQQIQCPSSVSFLPHRKATLHNHILSTMTLFTKSLNIRQCITQYCRFMFNVFQITIHNYTSSALNKKPARKLLQASNSERGIRTLDTAGMNRML